MVATKPQSVGRFDSPPSGRVFKRECSIELRALED
jgi:hypothetical protein